MKLTINVEDPERLKEALLFSQQNIEKPKDSLPAKLLYLLCYGEQKDDRTLYIGRDFVPNSFGFALIEEGQERCLIQGGLICHGQGVETLSVELSPKPGVYYSVHT